MALFPVPTFPARHGLSACLLALGLSGCATPPPSAVAVAELRPTHGNTTTGQVRFEQIGDMVRVSGEVRGLRPGGEHGFHVHEKGDCASGDGLSAGGHFNPGGTVHGRHGQPPHHVGDLPSLMADAGGVAHLRFETRALSLRSGPDSIMGKGLIVHRDPDDYRTQPTGNAGPRLACGVLLPG